MHRTQDTYPLSHFRQRTGEHLERIRDGRVETITQNGQAAMVVMSPERYDFLFTPPNGVTCGVRRSEPTGQVRAASRPTMRSTAWRLSSASPEERKTYHERTPR